MATLFTTLNNGLKMPLVGLGTWQSAPGEVRKAVLEGLRAGYRHLDLAPAYGNEAEVGDALKEAFAEGIVKREDLWITSKLWNSYHAKEHVEPAIRTTLKDLGIEYVDLWLIHWPHGFEYNGDQKFPKNEDGTMRFSYVPLKETWAGMEGVCKKGLTKAIGISNFNKRQILEVSEGAEIKPAVLQVECHPYFTQEKLIAFAKEQGIVVTAYSPLGAPTRPWAKEGEPSLLQDEKLVAIGKRLGKSSAQVVLRFQVQRGVAVIPKSVTPSRIAENFAIDNFTLSDEDMEYIKSFNRGWRACVATLTKPDGTVVVRDEAHPEWPFKDEY